MKKTIASLIVASVVAVAETSPVVGQTPIGVSYQPAVYWALPFHYANVKVSVVECFETVGGLS